ncbi:YitT family protein [Halobacillus yeomjeoni]|uniref:YitT family protein n=1 Tax=Halobacillus yeomjeoni TaxID=311194 RepID=A0A931MVV2_9BACI|nr:YitT family protein [Halobacillus yeomjeoni]MBH0231448.1 YitT family protein [Halobacillus yeomjeoni]MCA0984367.1 YitT family protein [Halobacillus yeomjeoni]
MKSFVKKGVSILFGSILLSLGINFFLIPDHVLDGGMIGLGMIMNYIWGLKVGFTIICFSIPIFTLAWFHYRAYFYNSLHGLLVSSFSIDIFHGLRDYHLALDPAISSIFGGALVGGGIGLMLRNQTSTGGTDLLAQMIADWVKLNVGFVIFAFDLLIIAASGYLFSTQTLLLSTITILSVGLVTMLLTSSRGGGHISIIEK